MVNINQFEEILKARSIPQPRSNLEERIIAMAARKPQIQENTSGLRALFYAFCDNFLLPAPAVTMVLVLCAGVTLGLNAQNMESGREVNSEDVSSYFQMSNTADFGDWS